MTELKRIRRARKLTQAQLAARSRVSQASISRLERTGQEPTLGVALRLAGALGVRHPASLFASSSEHAHKVGASAGRV